MHPIHRLEELGQSVWLDFLDRRILASGKLRRLIEEDGIRGVTSNPTIFQKAIAKTADYDEAIGGAPRSERDAEVLERLMVSELRIACDLLRPVYDSTEGADGFASIEVAPTLAGETGAEVEDAVRLWTAIDRPNLMVKIPGTRAGLPAIESCLCHGININVTLLFSVSRYREVLEAFMRALEKRVAIGRPIDRIASVASFFVSRVDTKVDAALDALGGDDAAALRGRIAIANAKLAYEEQHRLLDAARWKALADRGARTQRLLWASTSTKDPRYPDTYYADALVGRCTIDTMTLETLRAYLDQGRPEPRLDSEVEQAHRDIEALAPLGIDLCRVTDELEEEGVAKFADSYRATLAAISHKRSPATENVSRPMSV